MRIFFFQAEDGIRDGHVTGVQTCALPICGDRDRRDRRRVSGLSAGGGMEEGDAVTHPDSGCGRLAARHLSLAYDKVPVCRDVSLDIPGDEFTVIIGPNGCGKSTLLKALARSLRPVAGQVLLDDR